MRVCACVRAWVCVCVCVYVCVCVCDVILILLETSVGSSVERGADNTKVVSSILTQNSSEFVPYVRYH